MPTVKFLCFRESPRGRPLPLPPTRGFPFTKEVLSGCCSKSAVFPNQGSPCHRAIASFLPPTALGSSSRPSISICDASRRQPCCWTRCDARLGGLGRGPDSSGDGRRRRRRSGSEAPKRAELASAAADSRNYSGWGWFASFLLDPGGLQVRSPRNIAGDPSMPPHPKESTHQR